MQPSSPVLTLVPPGPAHPLRLRRLAVLRRVSAAALVAAMISVALALAFTRLRRDEAAAVRSALTPDPIAVAYRHQLALAAAPSAELAETITLMEARLTTVAPSPFDLAELAELYLRRAKLGGDPQDYAHSEALARRSLALLPTPNAAVLVLAKLAANRHDFREAIAFAQRHAHGHSTGATTVLATAHLALGELPAASAAAERLVRAQPSSAAYLLRALVLQAQGRDAEAAFDFTRAALAEEAGDLEAAARLRALWARFLVRRGEFAGAERLLAEALRILPGYPLALAQRGELELRTGHARQAGARFEEAFAASRQLRYLIDQARALRLAGDRPGADALRDQAEQLVRGELAAGGLGHRLELVELLLDQGSTAALQEAIGLARIEVERRPSADTRYQLARALHGAGRDDEARPHLEAALATGVHDAKLYRLAATLERRGHNAARAELYDRLAGQLEHGSAGWSLDGPVGE